MVTLLLLTKATTEVPVTYNSIPGQRGKGPVIYYSELNSRKEEVGISFPRSAKILKGKLCSFLRDKKCIQQKVREEWKWKMNGQKSHDKGKLIILTIE